MSICPPDNALKLTAGAALLDLLHGVTTLREAGDLDGTAFEAAQRLRRQRTHPVPRIVSAAAPSLAPATRPGSLIPSHVWPKSAP